MDLQRLPDKRLRGARRASVVAVEGTAYRAVLIEASDEVVAGDRRERERDASHRIAPVDPGWGGDVLVVATAFGGPEALAVVHQDVPAPGPGQVTVAVGAAGMNPIDCKLCSGHMGIPAWSRPSRRSVAAGTGSP